MKHILYLTRYFHSPYQAAGLRAQRFAAALASAGLYVQVVTVGDSGPECHDRLHLAVHSVSPEEVRAAAQTRRDRPHHARDSGDSIHANPPGPDADRGINEVFWARAVAVAQAQPVDLVLATGPPFGLLAVGQCVAETLSVPFIAELRDAWVTGMFWPYQNHRQRRAAQYWEQRCLCDAAKVIVVTDTVKKLLVEKYGPALEAKTLVVRHGYLPPEKKKRGQEPFFRMVYTGQLRGIDIVDRSPVDRALQVARQILLRGLTGARFCERLRLDWMSPHTLLQALGDLAKSDTGFAEKLRLVFAGQAFEQVDRWARRWGVQNNVEQRGPVPAEVAEQLVADADVLVLSLYGIAGCAYHWCVPSKVYSYLGSGNAILGLLPPGEAADLILRAGTGVVVAPDAVASVGSQIRRFFLRWQQGERLSRPDWEYIEQFELERQQQFFLEAILTDECVR